MPIPLKTATRIAATNGTTETNQLQERHDQLVKVRDEMIAQRDKHIEQANQLGERILIQNGAIGELNLILTKPA